MMTWEAEYLAKLKPVTVFSTATDEDKDEEAELEEEDGQEETDDGISGFSFVPIADVEPSPYQADLKARAYKRAWTTCERSIQSVLEGLYDTSIGEIEAFVKSARSAEAYAPQAVSAGLVIGANRSLATALSSALSKRLSTERDDIEAPSASANRRAVLVRLSSRECPNRKAAFRNLIQATIASATALDARGNEAARRTGGRKPPLLASDDMQTFLAWYRHKYSQRDKPNIAVYLEDFEAFDSSVLSDIIYVLSLHCSTIPFVLLFGISTSIDAVHTLLPRATSDLLRIVPFTVTQSAETFYALMQEVFINRTQPLSPGAKAFRLLRNTFLDYNQSLDAVVSKLQYMYMAHFFSNPLAFLGQSAEDDADDGEELLGESLTSLASHTRSLPSFRKHVEAVLAQSHVPATQKRQLCQSLQDDTALSELLGKSGEERLAYSTTIRHAWSMFNALQNTWEYSRVGDETMLTEYFAGKLVARARKTCAGLKRCRDELCLRFLRNANAAYEESDEAVPLQLDTALEELEHLMTYGQRQAGRHNLVNGNELGGVPQTEGDKAYTAMVAKLADKLEVYFENAFRPYSTLLFHELWYPDDDRLLRNTFHPPLMQNLQASLLAPTSRIPQHLLPPTSSSDPSSFLQTSALDTCQVYSLLINAGKFVNLADWHGAFETLKSDDRGATAISENGAEESDMEVEPSSLPSSRKKGNARTNGAPSTPRKRRRTGNGVKNGDGRSQLNGDGEHGENGGVESEVADTAVAMSRQQASCFLQGVADLGWLGVIQPTKRKAEHVARMVY